MFVKWSKFYPNYDRFNININVPNKSGVYLIWVKLMNGNWRCIYADKAQNLRSEMISQFNHDSLLRTNLDKFICGFEFAIIEEISLLSGICRYLYDSYKPECNIDITKSNPIFINLP